MTRDDTTWLGVEAIQTALAAGATSARALADATLARVERLACAVGVDQPLPAVLSLRGLVEADGLARAHSAPGTGRDVGPSASTTTNTSSSGRRSSSRAACGNAS